MQRKCCAHCPGDVTRTGEPAREHVCPVPGYVSGSLRLGAALAPGPDCPTESRKPPKLESQGSCFERFATAKKFHAENLEHQPLPDRVDDAIFTSGNEPADSAGLAACMRDTVQRCQRIVPRRQANRKKELSRVHRYPPALGCKKPTTYMDLAICWETPVNATYEPRRPLHIDGSDGGPAPAIFSLVQHDASQVDVREGCIPGQRRKPEEAHCHCKKCDRCAAQAIGDVDAEIKEELCRNLDSISLTEPRTMRPPVGAAARKKRAEFLRHCATNVGHAALPPAKKPGRPARSASCLQKRGCAVLERKSNGLPGSRTQIPRPRTPYARRSFCIDTLAPPFSIVTGCRDADYPEHWRLTSIYQQSYRNPRKMREGRTLLNYDRTFV